MTLNETFKKYKKECIGSIPTLAKSVRNMNYKRQKIINFFNKNIPDDEYLRNEKKQVINWLSSL